MKDLKKEVVEKENVGAGGTAGRRRFSCQSEVQSKYQEVSGAHYTE